MALQYITNVASKASPWSSKPVLTDEDEAFLQRVTSNPDDENKVSINTPEGINPLGRDAQTALMDGAQDIPLPMSPSEDIERGLPEQVTDTKEELNTVATTTNKKRRPWSLWAKKGSNEVNTKKVFLSAISIQRIISDTDNDERTKENKPRSTRTIYPQSQQLATASQ